MKSFAIAGAGLLLAGFFQLPSTPPMKLGLWESTSSMTMNIPGMTGPGRPPIVTKSRNCVNAETWAKAFTDSGRAGSCSRTNEKYAAGHLSFDMACPNVSGTGHGEMNFAAGAGQGKVHLDMNMAGRAVSSDMVIESHYVGADCGTVVPGKPEIIH